jgi:hypothetical protein
MRSGPLSSDVVGSCRPRRCARVAAAVAVLALAAGATATAAVTAGRYSGSTSEDHSCGRSGANLCAVTLVLPSKRMIGRFVISWWSRCATGRRFGGTSRVVQIPVTHNRFNGHFRSAGRTGSYFNEATNRYSGRFTHDGRVSGTYKVTVRIENASGRVIDHCANGSIRWTAAHR